MAPYPPMYPGAYPQGMETPHNKAVFEGMYAVRVKLIRAQDRCDNVGLSEKTLGYTESSQKYASLSDELKESRVWIEKYMQGLLEVN